MTDINDTESAAPEAEALDTPSSEDQSPDATPEEIAAADSAIEAAEAEDEEEGDAVVPSGRITLQELNDKTPADLVAFAEQLEIENAGNLRKQDLLFAILKALADEEVEIIASGVLEILSDGFGFLRSPDANYLPGPDDI